MKRLLAEYLPYYATGVVLGFVLFSLLEQTELLKEIHMMAREQRRMWLARLQRDMQSAAAAAKEPDSNG